MTQVYRYITLCKLFMRKLISLIIILIAVLIAWEAAGKYIPSLNKNINFSPIDLPRPSQNVKVINEESVTINLAKKLRGSVVAIGADNPSQSSSSNDLGPFSFFFNQDQQQSQPDVTPAQDQFIGSGFVVQNGLIITNKHVVSDNTLKYTVVDDKGNKYTANKIYRDPLNDIALIKISGTMSGIAEIPMGDSSNLQVGQYVLAFGTPLGQFKNSVTHGIISGLGRGITAGSPFEGFVEQLDNVIQTDAAINPGNSGGPLVNSSGQVIGINTAIAQQGQNIGFAIPINVIKDSIKNFNATGQFNRPYLGIAYRMITPQSPLPNNASQGALVDNVISGSSADKAGIQAGDIVTKIDGQAVTDTNGGIASVIGKKKIGDTITVTVNRNGKTMDLKATLQTAPNQ